ncbi:MAG: hypothetical protein AAF539_02480 [Planctomycetota bacterium]
MFRPLILTVLFACVMSHGVTLIAQDDRLGMLLERTPAVPNTLGYVNVESLNNLMRESGLTADVVREVDEYWFVADLDLMNVRPRWEAGYSTLKRPVTAEKLAETVGGYVDEIADRATVWAPGQTYFVPLDDQRLGVLRPANRQLLSGWLEPHPKLSYSKYLESKTKSPEEYLSLMVAIELKDVFAPAPLASKLKDLNSRKAMPAETIANILSSIQGVSILVGRRGLNECIVRAEFAKSPKSLKLMAADLLAEIAERNGTAAPEVRTWNVDVDETSLTFRGPITEATLSGVLGMFSLQQRASTVGQSLREESGSRSKQESVVYGTKAYFDQVTRIIEQTRKHESQTTGALAKWNDARARQIDELGTLDVDPQMIQYGTDVAETLRGNALTVRQGNIDAGKTKASQSLSTGYYGSASNGYGYDFNSTVDYQRVTDAYARGNAYSDYKSALNRIDQMTASIRRAMTDQFGVQF